MKKYLRITQLATFMVALVMFASPSFAMDVYLVAQEYSKTIDPDGGGPLPAETVTMWGFAESDSTFSSIGAPSSPGPVIAVPAGDPVLSITLRNDLAEPVSLVIPGQPAILNPVRSGNRVTALTNETGAGATVTYTWSNLHPGTFIYHSGSSLAKQVQMGLYGAVTVNANPGEIYPGVAFDNEVILFFSEIDPALHDSSSPGFANSTNYHPSYFLINGEPYRSDSAAINGGSANQRTLVRMLSTALDDLVPTILGTQWQLIAEDGNLYPFAKDQHTTLLSALKTKDAIVTPTQGGTFTIFDRRGNLTSKGVMPGGMMVQLAIGSAGLTADPDVAITGQGASVIINVLANDDPGSTEVDSVTQPANGSVTVNGDQTITYEPNAGFVGQDAFTYRATDGTLFSNWTTVTVLVSNVNDAPTATNDSYEVVQGQSLSVATPGVLANDNDSDGDPLTAVLDSGATLGTLVLNPDGSFTYTPNNGTNGDSFTYFANDATTNSATPATVTITVTGPPANQPPLAENDFGTTTRNVPITINVVANDSDPDGTINPASVVVTSGSTSTRGGGVVNNSNGTVTYTPRKNFRGTDTFTYTVNDNSGESSNEATVQVNVIK